MHLNVHYSTIYNRQDMEPTGMSTKRRTDEEDVGHIENGPFAVAVESLSLAQLFCNPMDCRPPGSSVHGIFQARILEWVAISYSKEYS